MRLSIVTHMPLLGLYFVRRLSSIACIEYIFVQRTRNSKFSISKLIDIPILCIQSLYLKYILKKDYELCSYFDKYNNLQKLSKLYGFKIVYTNNINEDDVVKKLLKDSNSKYICILGGDIINKSVLDSFKGKWINGHGGFLPNYRGLCSEYWTIKNKDFSKIGNTIHYATSIVDKGEILNRSTISYSKIEFIFMLELYNHLDLIDNYINTITYLNQDKLQKIVFDKSKSSYYSYPKKYFIKRLAMGYFL